MVQNKVADYSVAKTNQDVEQDKIFVYWKSPQDVAGAIFKWAKESGRIGSIETVLDIIEDEFNKDELFFDIPIELALNALYILQDEKKA